VLHFLEQPERALRELCRVNASGRLDVLLDLVPHAQEWMQEEMAHRWLGFDRSTIEKWFRAAGCTEVDFELTGSYAEERFKRNGKRPVEIFVARATVPKKANRGAIHRARR